MNGREKVIAVDFDDTISYTNLAICKWHNEKYGTNLSIDDFHSYYYWKNPGFGTPKEAMKKIEEFLLSGQINDLAPIEGAQRGTKALKEAGYTLVVITARMHQIADDSVEWLEKHFPGIFDTIYFTSAFQQAPEESQHLITELNGPPAHKHTSTHPTDPGGQHIPAISIPRKKSDVCLHVKAIALIDDAIENAFDVHQNAPVVECLVYGQWKWSLTYHTADRPEDQLSYEQLKAQGIDIEKEPPTPLPRGVQRTKTWTEVVQCVQKLEKN
jgi:hypothetical protein